MAPAGRAPQLGGRTQHDRRREARRVYKFELQASGGNSLPALCVTSPLLEHVTFGSKNLSPVLSQQMRVVTLKTPSSVFTLPSTLPLKQKQHVSPISRQAVSACGCRKRCWVVLEQHWCGAWPCPALPSGGWRFRLEQVFFSRVQCEWAGKTESAWGVRSGRGHHGRGPSRGL